MSVYHKILIILRSLAGYIILKVILYISDMKNILIPTDFSKNAGYAVNYGAEIAKKMHATATLLNAFHVPIFADQVYLEDTTIDNWEKDCENQLHEMATALFRDYNIQVKTDVKIGFTAEEIVAFDDKYDLVVMGSKGESSLDDVIFGNVTLEVIKRSKIPVLIIPPGVYYSPIKNIVLACNHEELITDSVAKVIKDFANLFGAKLYLLNIVREFDGSVSAAYNETDKIKTHFDGIDASLNVLRQKEIVKGINEFSENINADVVIMIPEKHSLIERMFSEIHTRHMAKIANRPLLIIPPV